MKNIGNLIKEYRKDKGMTQQQLADKIGKHKITIAKYESGKITNIPFDVLSEIAKALDVDIYDLYDWLGAERYFNKAYTTIIEKLEDLNFTIDRDEKDDIYNRIVLCDSKRNFIKFIDKNDLLDAYDNKNDTVDLKRIFTTKEYDKYILGIPDNSPFLDYLKKKYDIKLTETPNGYYGYLYIFIGNAQYKIDYDHIERIENDLLKYLENILLEDYKDEDEVEE